MQNKEKYFKGSECERRLQLFPIMQSHVTVLSDIFVKTHVCVYDMDFFIKTFALETLSDFFTFLVENERGRAGRL